MRRTPRRGRSSPSGSCRRAPPTALKRQDVARLPERRKGLRTWSSPRREGFQSVEHAKRYTTLGRATDQGKLSNLNGLAVLSGALTPQSRRSAPRPSARPLRAAHPRHHRGRRGGTTCSSPFARRPCTTGDERHGATWEPVGLWRRPYAYPRAPARTPTPL
jgi:hypothetical protein